MQFSIRRPKLPSSETHPEESVHRRLDVPAWLSHLNELGQVEEEYKLRKVRLEPGPPHARPGRPVRGPATRRFQLQGLGRDGRATPRGGIDIEMSLAVPVWESGAALSPRKQVQIAAPESRHQLSGGAAEPRRPSPGTWGRFERPVLAPPQLLPPPPGHFLRRH